MTSRRRDIITAALSEAQRELAVSITLAYESDRTPNPNGDWIIDRSHQPDRNTKGTMGRQPVSAKVLADLATSFTPGVVKFCSSNVVACLVNEHLPISYHSVPVVGDTSLWFNNSPTFRSPDAR